MWEMSRCSLIWFQTWWKVGRVTAALRAWREARYWRSVVFLRASKFRMASAHLCPCLCADYGERPLPLPLAPDAGNPYEPDLEEEYYWQGSSGELFNQLFMPCKCVTAVFNNARICWNLRRNVSIRTWEKPKIKGAFTHYMLNPYIFNLYNYRY